MFVKIPSGYKIITNKDLDVGSLPFHFLLEGIFMKIYLIVSKGIFLITYSKTFIKRF